MKLSLNLRGLVFDGMSLPFVVSIVMLLTMRTEITNAVGMGDRCGPPNYKICDKGLICLIGQDDKFRCQENSNMNPEQAAEEDGAGDYRDEFPPILQRLYDALYRVQTDYNQNNYDYKK